VKITPEYISQLINFYSNTIEPEWSYSPLAKDMRNLQVKGAARIFNLLEEKKIALLADEVGMGKTIQALAVCAALWNEKPDAKILILAPRDEIAKNWEKEYQTFIRHHYRHNDNIVKSISGHEPVKKLIYCSNLYNLVHEIQQEWGQLFIGKISSFSSLMAKKDVIEWLENLNIKGLSRARRLAPLKDEEFNNEIARLLKNEIVQYAKGNKPYFDLIIIDEAHYFRKKEGDGIKNNSLKVNTAREFFGNPQSNDYIPISGKILLMTATPNHSSSKDIGNIVSYFTKKYADVSYKTILDNICVRRLRRLSKRGVNKYNYRKEIPSPSDFKDNPLSEMFFGLYQHELAKEINKSKSGKQGGRGISRMMKYLEGVEFIPFEKPQQPEEESEDDVKSNSSDYTIGSDAQLLLGISKRFQEIFNENPKHPKYDKLVEDLTIKHHGEKAVVFVRRIPSVFEIAKRIIEFYDKKMWDRLKIANLGSLSYEKLDRASFKKVNSKIEISNDEDIDFAMDGEVDERNIPSSKVLNLFKIVKNSSIKSTHASNFRLRFNHSKPNIFAIFFSPGEDYFSKPYEDLYSLRFIVGKEELENYYNSALIHRTTKISEEAISKDILSALLPKNSIEDSGEIKDFKIQTLFTIFWDVFLSDPEIAMEQKRTIESTYRSFTYYEKEAFSNFIEKGILLASVGIIWFYEIYRKIQEGEDDKPIFVYQNFVNAVKLGLRNAKLYNQIQESILHFRPIYTKVFSINGDKKLLEETWDSFNNAQPIYPYNAANSNQKVLRSFNTPFFPDILVATSVLQEGVNLQYFCNTIYHYGMAWTPGDNEQRIGRIDRMFGKIERLLDEDENSCLNIYYPYLKDTIDEEHLGRFAKRKYKEEALIDQGKAFEETADFALEENDNDSWKSFLRIPNRNEMNDPFPVNSNHFNDIKTPPLRKSESSLTGFYYSIINALKGLSSYEPEIYFVNQNENQKLLIDPTLNGNRKQPVIIELIFDNIGTGFQGKSVFCLRMRTPLESYSKFKFLRKKFNESSPLQNLYLPGIKLCLDPSQTGGSSWGLYMVTELPLFITNLNENPLSIEEIQDAFVNLIKFADHTEKEIFEKDLQKEELNLPVNNPHTNNNANFRKSKKQVIADHWIEEDGFFILEEEVEVENKKYSDIERQALIDNHNNFYVKTFKRNGKWLYQVSMITKDAHKVELQLLEKHFKVVINKMVW
jgi:superfamily II DNA or RNA helicase